MPQPFPQPRHPDDTPDAPTPLLNVGGALLEERGPDGRIIRYRLDDTRDATTSPLRRALSIALRHRPRRSKEN